MSKRIEVVMPTAEEIIKMYENYDSDGQSIRVPQREHLGRSFSRGVCCDHRWQDVPLVKDPADLIPTNLDWFKKNFEVEEIEHGQVCETCGATCIREKGRILAYDGTSHLFGYGIPKRRESRGSNQPARRK